MKLSGIGGDCIAIFAIPFNSYYSDETNISQWYLRGVEFQIMLFLHALNVARAYVNSALAKDEVLIFGFDETIVL